MRARRGRFAVLIPLIGAGLLAAPALTAVPGRAAAETAPTVDRFESPHSLVGSYLAGRFARAEHDAAEAAEFYRAALDRDPENEMLLEQAFMTEAGRGSWPSAFRYAERLVAVQPQNRTAQTALALEAFHKGAYAKAEAYLKAANGGPIGELTAALAGAWTKLAEGDPKEALHKLELSKQSDWVQFFLRYHKALIADIAGRKQDAAAAYEAAFKQDTRTLRTALAYAQHAAAAGDRKLALGIVQDHLDRSQSDGHPLLRSLKMSLEANRPVGLIITKPNEGMSEAFYGLGEVLINEGAIGMGMIYLQMALYSEPANEFALASLASAYETMKDYGEAIATYERIPGTSPLSTAIEIRKALNLNSLERADDARDTLARLLDETPKPAPAPVAAAASPAPAAAVDDFKPRGHRIEPRDRGLRVEKLQAALKAIGYDVEPDGSFGKSTRDAVMDIQKKNGLKADGIVGDETYDAVIAARAGGSAPKVASQEPPARLPLTISDKLEILDSLGNILRSRKQYAEAIPLYDKALALVDKPDKRHWIYYYARGTSYERLKNWPAAEADLKKALELFPDQPLVLNYLGYSWIDQGINFKEGMSFIEKAVTLKPDDGYIVDSLGWAHFRQGNYKEAVRYLERAVELKPDDATLNDHLGDALWRVGREREAHYAWDEALELKPEPDDAAKIKQKLERGLEPLEKATAGAQPASSTGTQPTPQ